MTLDGIGPAERDVLLALADDEHLMGQRHTEWIGVAPFLEEDLAFASIGQDELGHAAMLYELLADDGDVDTLALGRDPGEYRSCWLAEAECADWAEALVRHWLYDEAELLRWSALERSELQPLRGIAERALTEEVYHRRHAAALLDALLDEPTPRERLGDAMSRLAPLAVALFEPPPGQDAADLAVVGAPLTSMLTEWSAAVSGRFAPAASVGAAMAGRGQERRTSRSAAFGPMYSRMREVLVLDPTARW